MATDRDPKKPGVVHIPGLVIRVPQSLESENWLKVVYLVRKGYTREEAIALMHKIQADEIKNIDDIPPKPGAPEEGE